MLTAVGSLLITVPKKLCTVAALIPEGTEGFQLP